MKKIIILYGLLSLGIIILIPHIILSILIQIVLFSKMISLYKSYLKRLNGKSKKYDTMEYFKEMTSVFTSKDEELFMAQYAGIYLNDKEYLELLENYRLRFYGGSSEALEILEKNLPNKGKDKGDNL